MNTIALLAVLLCFSGPGPSKAVANVADAKSARALFDDYTNNILRVASIGTNEFLTANMPFQLVSGPTEADRLAAETAIETVEISLPRHVRAFFERHHRMGPVTQMILHRACKAPCAVWRATNFDLTSIANLSRSMTSNDVPLMPVVYPIFTEFKQSPITPAKPLVDYPDPRPELVYSLPFGTSFVLRAPELKRKFRFCAQGWPLNDKKVTFKWEVRSETGSRGYRIAPFTGRLDMRPERGYAEITLDWKGVSRRMDVFVFARYGEGPWGAPSVISFYTVPNEKRTYDKQGRIQKIEYAKSERVLPQLWQNKPWRDEFFRNGSGELVGFLRYRGTEPKGTLFSNEGEVVIESYANEAPMRSHAVRYFTLPDDPTTLDYEVLEDEIKHPPRDRITRDRGEFGPAGGLRKPRSRFRLGL